MYDIAIIGGGVTGCSIARELSKYKFNTVILEKGTEVCQGATKANSAIVHGGYDAKEGTLKAKLNVKGNKMHTNLCYELNVEFKRIGSLVIAFDEEDMKTINTLYNRGIANGVEGLRIIKDKNEIKVLEPNINDKVIGVLFCESSGIVCPFDLNYALVENAIKNGVELKTEHHVINIEKKEDYFHIYTTKETIKSKYIINAAGVYADEINKMIGGNEYYIIPRKGEYRVLDKSESKNINHVLFQCPSSKGKGVLITPTVHNNVLLGPTAVEVDDKEDISVSDYSLEFISNSAKKVIPKIDVYKTITSFAGLRATPNTRDFMIFASNKCRGFINVGGIESPGLTAAPAIAEYVIEILKKEGLEFIKKEKFNPFREKAKQFRNMTKEEREEAIKINKKYNKIICKCEQVTEAEIIDAIHRPAGAKTIDGIKRRVRPGMGRCQGGFCGPRVVEILAKELNIPVEDVIKDKKNSKMILGKMKEKIKETGNT